MDKMQVCGTCDLGSIPGESTKLPVTKICDNKSVGMLVWRDRAILLIERKQPPFGFAPPAGHVDEDDTVELAAKRELKEEVGLDVVGIKLVIEGRKENHCRRVGGSWHYWHIYDVQTEGEIKRSLAETKQASFYDHQALLRLANRTEQYKRGDITEKDWERDPGLEPVWYEWFVTLNII